MAVATSRVRIGCMVSGNSYRHPVMLAKLATTVDHLSGGRLELGIGAGWNEHEHTMYGLDLGSVRTRMGRLEESLQVLSLGCTTEPVRTNLRQRFSPGLTYWLPRIVDLFMVAQSSASLGTAAVLVGHENVVRISPVVPPGRFRLDSVGDIASLRGLGAAEARKALPNLRRTFFTEPAEAFRPCHELATR